MDLTPEQIEAIKKALESMGKSASEVSAVLAAMTTAAKHAGTSYETIIKGLKEQHKEVKSGNKSFKDLGSELTYTQKQINRLSDAAEKERAQKLLNIYAEKAYRAQLDASMKDLIGQSAITLATTYYDYFKNQVLTGVKGLLGDGSPIQVAADLQTAAIDSLAKGATSFGDTVSTVGKGLLAVPNIYAQVVGGLLTLGGSALSQGAREAAELQKARIQIISQELDKTYNSFKQATAAGALFAGGLSELRAVAAKAGLTQQDFSKIIAENSEAMAAFGGSVTNGAQKLAGITAEFAKGTRKQLLNLGISIEEQAQGAADYLAMLQQSGNLQGKSTEELSKGSKEYLINLKAISSFTGEEAKRAEARAREAASQASVQSKLAALGPEAAAKFNALIKLYGPGYETALQQLLVYGTVTGDNAVALAQVPALLEHMQSSIRNVTDSNVKLDSATSSFQNRLRETQPILQQQALAASDAIGGAALMTNNLANVSKVLGSATELSFKNVNELSIDTASAAKSASNTQDELTERISASVDAFKQLQIALQQDLTQALKNFAIEIPKILTDLREKLVKLGLIKGSVEVEETLPGFGGSLGAEIGGGFGGIAYDSISTVGGYAAGGIAQGPLSGYTATLHGTEAVVPLPAGGKIPVDLKLNTTDILTNQSNNIMIGQLEKIAQSMQNIMRPTEVSTPDAELANKFAQLSTSLNEVRDAARAQLEKHEQMIRHLQDHKDISERMLNNSY